MDRLVYTATTAMTEYRLDRQTLTHELANVSTIGFKKAFQIANRSVRVEGDGFDSRFLPRAVSSPQIDLAVGPLQVTGRSLDIAMNDKTLLPVLSENNELAWTRRGDLRTDSEGFLTTGEGYAVLDDTGAQIQLPQGSYGFEIDPDGTINATDRQNLAAGAVPINRIGIKDATGVEIARREDGLFRPLTNTEDGQDFAPGSGVPSLTSGAVESSNVNVVHALVKFIDHVRSFEMQTKVIKEMKDNDSSASAMMRLS